MEVEMGLDPCPRCQSTRTTLGHLTAHEQAPASNFIPSKTRFSFQGFLPVELIDPMVHACMSCGLVWSEVSPTSLLIFIEKNGREVARQVIDEIPPAFKDPEFEVVLAAIREIDGLILSNQAPAATRRLRETAPIIWDQAIEAIRHWADMPHEAKYALYGWETKSLVDDGLA
jgi:hypothetical protein